MCWPEERARLLERDRHRAAFTVSGELDAIQQELMARKEKEFTVSSLLRSVPEYNRGRLESSLARERAEALEDYCKRFVRRLML